MMCNMRLIVVVLFVALILEVNGFGLNFWKLKSSLERNLLTRHKMQHQSSEAPNFRHLQGSNVMVQPLDHFDPQVKRTYNQRYWVNPEFFTSPAGPVFLYVGGEGSLNDYVVYDRAFVTFADTYGALIIAVEHRFYGQSLNDDGLKTENLRYLSSQQALADLANFHQHISKVYNLTENNKWISFGGSYPGALSAWFRIKYPHLVHGAVASSAPVRALVDFKGYNDVVAKSLTTTIVGGSQKCHNMVKDAFQVVDDLLSKGNLTALSHDFLSCAPIESEKDVFQLTSNIADIFMGTVQYNNEDPSALNIKTVCQIMTQTTEAYQNMINLNKKFLQQSSQNCSDNSWQSFIQQLSNVTLDRTQDVNMRQWTYQTCAQFGYYQACDDKDCLFSRHMTLPPNFDICVSVFNISQEEVYDRVDFTNSYYGADEPRGSRILFVNGLIDPWHALSVLKDVSKSELALVIPSTAHCADMHNDSPDDPPELTAARQKISSQIGRWLSEPDVEAADSRGQYRNKHPLFQKL